MRNITTETKWECFFVFLNVYFNRYFYLMVVENEIPYTIIVNQTR